MREGEGREERRERITFLMRGSKARGEGGREGGREGGKGEEERKR